MKWEGQVDVDKVLRFGLRSAPKLYNAVGDALLWILVQLDRLDGLHYLDGFLLFSGPDSSNCETSLWQALACCMALGVLVAPGKTEGPCTRLVFLGIDIDTLSMSLQLPTVELDNFRAIQKESCYPLLVNCSMRAASSSLAAPF